MGVIRMNRVGGWMCVLALGVACGGGREAAWDTTPNGEGTSNVSDDQRASLAQEAQAAWDGRDEEASVRQAIEKYSAVTSADASDHEAWVMLSRSYYFLADCHLRFDEARQEEFLSSFEEGTQAAERGLVAISDDFAQRMRSGTRIEEAIDVLDQSAVPALYWRASNLGKWASADGFATLLSYKDEIRAVMGRCLELDRPYYHYGPDRYFGVFYGRAPGFAGGDVERSREHFEASMRQVPNYFATRVLMAQDYAVKAQDRATFDEQLTYVIEHDAEEGGAEVAPENRCEQRKARDLMSQADELFE
ncbi:MAG: TRAP transporter TatT component family protein [Myxococcota bacterium]